MPSIKTINIESRMDARDLATILRFYRNNGFHPETKSRLVAMCVEDLARAIVSQAGAEPFTTTGQALDFLEQHFSGISKGSARSTLMEVLRVERSTTPQEELSEEDNARIKELLKQMEGDPEQ